jgi:hypothetical protein
MISIWDVLIVAAGWAIYAGAVGYALHINRKP